MHWHYKLVETFSVELALLVVHHTVLFLPDLNVWVLCQSPFFLLTWVCKHIFHRVAAVVALQYFCFKCTLDMFVCFVFLIVVGMHHADGDNCCSSMWFFFVLVVFTPTPTLLLLCVRSLMWSCQLITCAFLLT